MTRVAWPAALVVGLVLMLAFEDPLTRVLGLLCLAAFVVLGVGIIASPEYLADDPEEEAPAASSSPRRR